MESALHFLAIIPPEDIADEITEFKRLVFSNFGSKRSLNAPAHITIIPPFHLKNDEENELFHLLDLIKFPCFDIELNGFGCFENRRRKNPVLFVNPILSPVFTEFYIFVQDRLAKNFSFIKKENREFHPHITIGFKDLSLENFDKGWEFFKDKEYQRFFSADTFSILRFNQIEKCWEVLRHFQFAHSL